MKLNIKCIVKIVMFLLITYLCIVYLPITNAEDVINDIYENPKAISINVYVEYNMWLNKDYTVSDKNKVDVLLEYLGSIRVRRKELMNPIYNIDNAIDEYRLKIILDNKKSMFINITGDRCLVIGKRAYYTIDKIDYRKIYSIILSDQELDKIDQYYKDIIEQL